jgi:ribosome-binding factor A
MSKRVEQVGTTLHRAVQSVISKGFADPRIRGLITVTRVQVSADLSDATVFISVTPEDAEELTMHGLRSAARHIRHEVGELVALRRVPALHLKLDRTTKEQSAVLGAIREAAASLKPAEPDEEDRETT